MAETITIDDQQGLDAFFARLADDFYRAPMRELMEGELAIVEEDARQRFAAQVDPNGAGWAPLKPATIKRKGFPNILVETGALGVSLVERGHPDAVYEVVDEPGQGGFSRGTSNETAAYHQSGTRRMPARPPVGVSPDYADGFAERSADQLVEHLKQGA